MDDVSRSGPVYHRVSISEIARLARASPRDRSDFARALAETDAGSGSVRLHLWQPGTARLSRASWRRLARHGFAKRDARGRPKLIARDTGESSGWITNGATELLPSAAWLVLAAMHAEMSYSEIARVTGWTLGYVQQMAQDLIVNGWISDDSRPTPANRASSGRFVRAYAPRAAGATLAWCEGSGPQAWQATIG